MTPAEVYLFVGRFPGVHVCGGEALHTARSAATENPLMWPAVI